jgi:hypothetical protein
MHKNFLTLFFLCAVVNIAGAQTGKKQQQKTSDDPEYLFLHPPESAKPGVLWMWMGSNLSKSGITKDLEALREEGFNHTTMLSLADVVTPWANQIGKSPTPEIISWTEPWWDLVKHAARESKRLKMDFGTFNGPSYETSGGPWITPELSMQEICLSADTVHGGATVTEQLPRPKVDPHANELFPLYNPNTGLVEKPEIEARKTYYKDIAVLALPPSGPVAKNDVIDITDKMNADGKLIWEAPPGVWVVYRIGHTTTGSLIQPAQWKATGLECDKMSLQAVSFHIDHVLNEIKKHLGDFVGNTFSHIYFDSYEAGWPSWTPKFKEEFLQRRGYDITPWLAMFADRRIGSIADSVKFGNDFDATMKDLYRDIYFKTISEKLKNAHLDFMSEPYGGPWTVSEVVPYVHKVMIEFWTHGGKYDPYLADETLAAVRKSGQNIVESEAFTGEPIDSKWSENPEWLKPIGDAAYCVGVNRFIIHRFVEQPWDDKYKPGATMGRWGTHFDRTQTWWQPAKATVKYWQRCQAILQWGTFAAAGDKDFIAIPNDTIAIKFTHRHKANTDIYFVANTTRDTGTALCSFNISGMQPELWDPVSTSIRTLYQFEEKDGKTFITIPFEKAQSYFIVFRKKSTNVARKKIENFVSLKKVSEISGAWKVKFDSVWGGPAKTVVLNELQDWTENINPGIKYYSGTAIYNKTFDFPASVIADKKAILYLDLGVVKHIAHVFVNGNDLGIVWTSPWRVRIPAALLKNKNNYLSVEVTNVWANRLIGDEQEPADCEWLPGHLDSGRFLKEFPDWFLKKQPRPSKGRYCFTTWNYFTKDSPLIPSGLIGPVSIVKEN